MSEDENDEEVREMLADIQRTLDDEAKLEPTAPREAYELWMQTHSDKAESTISTYERRLRPFLAFCADNGITNLNDLQTRHIKEFESERRAEGYDPQTLNNRFGTVRQFLRYCWELNAVSESISKALDVPNLDKEERINTEKLIAERALDILDDLEKYRYATKRHVTLLLLWRTTARIGTLRALDLEDLYLNEDDVERLRQELREGGHTEEVVNRILEEARPPFIFPRHRPATDTPLKNGGGGERVINLSDDTAEVVQEYIRVNRPDVSDEYGREALLASRRGMGRYSTGWIRNTCYLMTQPCEFGAPCPHDRDPETCEAREHGYGSQCPSARSPHKLRTGSITWHRDRGWPIDDLSQKANTSEELIEGVYDQPEALIRGASRRHHLDKLDGDSDV